MPFKWRQGFESQVNKRNWQKLAAEAEEKKRALQLVSISQQEATQERRQAQIDAQTRAIKIPPSRFLSPTAVRNRAEESNVLSTRAENSSLLSKAFVRKSRNSPLSDSNEEQEDLRQRDQMQRALKAAGLTPVKSISLSLLLHPNSIVGLDAFDENDRPTIEAIRNGDMESLGRLAIDKPGIERVINSGARVLSSRYANYAKQAEEDVGRTFTNSQIPRWKDFIKPVSTRKLLEGFAVENAAGLSGVDVRTQTQLYSPNKDKALTAVMTLSGEQAQEFIIEWVDSQYTTKVLKGETPAPVPIFGEMVKPELDRLLNIPFAEGRKLTDDEFEQAYMLFLIAGAPKNSWDEGAFSQLEEKLGRITPEEQIPI